MCCVMFRRLLLSVVLCVCVVCVCVCVCGRTYFDDACVVFVVGVVLLRRDICILCVRPVVYVSSSY